MSIEIKEGRLFEGKFLNVDLVNMDGKPREVLSLNDAVAAIVTNSKSEILLVKQKRPVTMTECWEIPAGMLDVDGEHPEKGMVREIEEETGIIVENGRFLLKYLPIIGCVKHEISLYQFNTEQETKEKEWDVNDEDVTKAGWFSREEIHKMISKGEISDGKTIVAFLSFMYF